MARVNLSSNDNSSGDRLCLEYILAIDDFGFDSFLNDSRTKAVASKTNCLVELTPRILNKRINLYRWTKYAIIKVTGPDEPTINQCLRLIEKQFPIFLHRKEYSRRANVTMFTNELYFPDNTPGSTKMIRSGSTMSCCQGLAVKSPYSSDEKRPMDQTVWKTNKSEMEGCYVSGLPMQRCSQPQLFFKSQRMSTFSHSNNKFSSNEVFGLLGTLSKNSQSYIGGPIPSSENLIVRVSVDNVDKDAKESQTGYLKSEPRVESFDKSHPNKAETKGVQIDFNSVTSATSVDQKTLIKIGFSSLTSMDKLHFADDALLETANHTDRKVFEEGDRKLQQSSEKLPKSEDDFMPSQFSLMPRNETASYISCTGFRISEKRASENVTNADTEDRDMPLNISGVINKTLNEIPRIGDDLELSLDVDGKEDSMMDSSEKERTSQSSVNSLKQFKHSGGYSSARPNKNIVMEFESLVGSSPNNDKNLSLKVGINSQTSFHKISFSHDSVVDNIGSKNVVKRDMDLSLSDERAGYDNDASLALIPNVDPEELSKDINVSRVATKTLVTAKVSRESVASIAATTSQDRRIQKKPSIEEISKTAKVKKENSKDTEVGKSEARTNASRNSVDMSYERLIISSPPDQIPDDFTAIGKDITEKNINKSESGLDSVASTIRITISVGTEENHPVVKITANMVNQASENIEVPKEPEKVVENNIEPFPESTHVLMSVKSEMSEHSSQSITINVNHAGQLENRERVENVRASPIEPHVLGKANVSVTDISIHAATSTNVVNPNERLGRLDPERTKPIPEKSIQTRRSVSMSHDDASTTMSLVVHKIDEKDPDQISALLEIHKSTKSSEGLVYLSDYQQHEMEFKLGDTRGDTNVMTRLNSIDQISLDRNQILSSKPREPSKQLLTEINVRKVSGIKFNMSVSHTSTETPNGVYVKGINDMTRHSKGAGTKFEEPMDNNDIVKLMYDKLRAPREDILVLLFEGRNIYSTGSMSIAIMPTGDGTDSCYYDFESSHYSIKVKYINGLLKLVNPKDKRG